MTTEAAPTTPSPSPSPENQEKWAEKVRLYQALFELIDTIICERDFSTETIHWSGSFTKILGYSPEEMGSDFNSWANRIYPEDRPRILAELESEMAIARAENFANYRNFDLNYRFLHQDGSYCRVREQGAIAGTDSSVKVVGMISETGNATEREFLLNVINTSENLIFVKNIAGQFQFANAAVAKIYGCENPKNLIGKTDADFNSNAEEVARFLAADREVLTTLRPKTIAEETVTSPNGTIRYFETTKKPLFLAGEKVPQLLGVSNEITKYKRVEAALKQLNTELETKVLTRTEALRQAYIELERQTSERLATELQLGVVLDAAQMGTWEFNLPTQQVIWSERAEAIFGFEKGTFPGTEAAFLNCLHPEDAPAFMAEIATAIAQRIPHKGETRIIWPDGTVRWIAGTGSIICDSQGQPTRMTGVVMDITERQQAEEALIANEARLQLALKISQMGTWDWNATTGEIVWSETTETIFGFAPGTFPGTYAAYLERIHPEDRDYLVRTIAHALETGEVYDIEHRICWLDNSLRWVQAKGQVRYASGVAVGMSGVVLDITKSKTTEAILRESEERYRLMANNSTDLISRHSAAGIYLYASPASLTLLGYEPEELIGKSAYEFFHPQDLIAIQQSHSTILHRPEITIVTYRIRCRDSNYIWFETTSHTIHREDGEQEILCVSRDVTQRKQAEMELQKVLRLQQAILDSANYTIIATDSYGTINTFNAAAERLLGYTAAEVVGKNNPGLFHDMEEIIQRTQELSQELGTEIEPGFEVFVCKAKLGETEEREWSYIRKDGSRFPVWLSVTALRDEEDTIVGFLGIGSDISEQKQIQERLRLRDRAIAASSNGIIISDARDPNRPVIYANPAFERMTGYTAKEVLGQNCRFLQGRDRQQPELQKVRQAIRDGKDCTVILRNYRKDGTLFWNELSIAPIYDPKGHLTHFIGIQTNVTERKQAEAAIQQAKDQLQAVLDAVPGLVSWIGADLRYLGINQHLADIFQQPPEVFVGKEVGFMETNSKFAEFMRQFFSTSAMQTSQEIDIQIAGKLHSYLIVAQKYQQGEAAASVGIDISSRHRIEEELRKSLEKEKELSELKSRFVTTVSHEVRTPLASIVLSAGMLERYDATWSLEKKKNHWQKIQSSADRIQDLLENVLRLGSADSGNLQFNPVKTDLKLLLEKIVEEAAASDRGAHPILLTVPEIDPVPLDQNFIEHILSNLLSNAIKYSPNQNAIQLRSIFQDHQIIFEVADRGIGIPPEDIPDLFEPFHRASNSSNVPGTGLGLTIVNRFVKLHGGTISVDSTIDIGTTFTITIPLLSHYKL